MKGQINFTNQYHLFTITDMALIENNAKVAADIALNLCTRHQTYCSSTGLQHTPLLSSSTKRSPVSLKFYSLTSSDNICFYNKFHRIIKLNSFHTLNVCFFLVFYYYNYI